MHVFGSTIVGSITALGGGTINNLITGVSPVGWVRDPTFLAITTVASFTGFYVWPVLERYYKNYCKECVCGGKMGDRDKGGREEGSSFPFALPSLSLLRYSMESVGERKQGA